MMTFFFSPGHQGSPRGRPAGWQEPGDRGHVSRRRQEVSHEDAAARGDRELRRRDRGGEGEGGGRQPQGSIRRSRSALKPSSRLFFWEKMF